MAGGRPTRYRKEYADQARKLCRLGATDEELADFYGVVPRTIYNWKDRHPEFFQAIKEGTATPDDQVERSLFQKATGYTVKETKVIVVDGEIRTVELEKHYPPSDTAMIFWLKNRRKEDWRDRREIEHDHKGEFGITGWNVTDEDGDEV